MSNFGQIITAVVGVVAGIIANIYYPGSGVFVFAIISGIGSALFPSATEKPRPQEMQFQTSAYGGTIPVLYGTRKLSGNCLWYANFQAHEVMAEGGKGGSSQVAGYSYTVSLAFGLCMNTAGATGMSVTRLWVGKNEKDLATMITNDEIRIYDGNQTAPDSHMAGFLARAPVYKGLCWVVLPNFNLGNSPYIPNLTFEVGGTLEVIPGLAYYSRFPTLGASGSASFPPPEVVVTDQWVSIGMGESWWSPNSGGGWSTDRWVADSVAGFYHFIEWDEDDPSWQQGIRFSKIRFTISGATPKGSIQVWGENLIPYGTTIENLVEYDVTWPADGNFGYVEFWFDGAWETFEVTNIEIYTSDTIVAPV